MDGTPPPDDIVDKFLDAAEKEKGGIAIHCKAGLGRTGSLIALYCMKHFGFPPQAFIGWIRIARPGSILGPQQNYLCSMDARMMAIGGDQKRRELMAQVSSNKVSDQLDAMTLGMSEEEMKVAKYGDIGQGEKLAAAKNKRNRK